MAKKYVLVTDNDLISCLVSSAYERDYCQFFSKAFYDFNFDYSIFEANTPTKDLCLLKSCLFVVKDKDLFIENLNKIFKGNKQFGVNQGPKKLRGEANSLKNILYDLDKDFRNSLFDQIKYHNYKGNLNSFNIEIALRNFKFYFRLPVFKYSYKNVHITVGKLRWYSNKIPVKNREGNTNTVQNFGSIYDMTDNIISVKQYKNLEQISVQNLIIDENRGKVGIYL